MNSKELVLKEMFKGKENNYSGYDNICNKLIETGVCLTTIRASIIFKNGGIHNFVKQEPYEYGVDLLKLSIDKEEIYSSKLFEEYKTYMLDKKQMELDELMKEVKPLQDFINDLID